MVKPSVFSSDQDPKKEKQREIHCISVRELPQKSTSEDEEPLITWRTEVCTPKRCACMALLVVFMVICCIGVGVGLYAHFQIREHQEMIKQQELEQQRREQIANTMDNHPYGEDALFPVPPGGRHYPPRHHPELPFRREKGGWGYGDHGFYRRGGLREEVISNAVGPGPERHHPVRERHHGLRDSKDRQRSDQHPGQPHPPLP